MFGLYPGPVTPGAIASDSTPPPAGITTGVLDELTDEASDIIIGSVDTVASYWNEDRTAIFSTVSLAVDEVLKGTPGETVTVTVPGGEADGIGQWVSGAPMFTADETAVVFLKKQPKARFAQAEPGTDPAEIESYEISGGAYGKLAVADGRVGSLALDDFTSTVRLAVDEQLPELVQMASGESLETFAYSYDGIHWSFPPDPVVQYRINENCGDLAGEGAAIQAAAATWNAAGARFSFSYAGTTAATSYGFDGVNEVLFRNFGSGGTIGLTYVWYNPTTGVISECDMELNDYYSWGIGAIPAKFDVQTIATHEFGHFLCLQDLYDGPDGDKIMYGYGSMNTTKRTLHADDIAGIRAIYGLAVTAPAVSNGEGALDITTSSATLSGQLTSTGGENPTVHIYWGDNNGGTTPANWDHDVNMGALPAGNFFTDVTGLSDGTPYYYRSYAVNSGGGTWAPSTAMFTTVHLRDLTLSVTGNGTVSPVPGTHTYEDGTVVAINTAPATGWRFDGWTGETATVNSTSSPNATITMNGDYTIAANFSSNATLAVSVNGSGTVNPGTGPHIYPVGSTVNLTAAPDAGWRFSHWTGDVADVADVDSANTTVAMHDNYGITAVFDQPVLSMSVNGSGTVFPAAGNHICPVGETVTVTANASVNWEFINWTGNVADPNAGNTTIVIDTDRTVTANFARTQGTLNLSASGSGTVVPVSGNHTYTVGSTENITATPAPGWRFSGWTGDTAMINDPSAASTNITVNGDYNVTAVFTQPVLTMAVSGSGSVSPASGNHTYDLGASVNITAIPSSGWQFSGWTGDTAAVGNADSASTNITLHDDYTVTAVFTPLPAPPAAPPSGGGGGGGGGGGTDDKRFTNISGSASMDGILWEEVLAQSVDIKAELLVGEGTAALNRNGYPLFTITVATVGDPPDANPGTARIGEVYDFSPDGSTFSPAALLTLYYDDDMLPEGVSEANLYISLWNEVTETWDRLECVIDTGANTVSAFISHFSRYTILAGTQPAEFSVSDMAVTPGEVHQGDTITVSATVSNNGDLAGSHTLSLQLDGQEVRTHSISLDGGESRDVSFTLTAGGPGTYALSLESSRRSFTVIEKILAAPLPEDFITSPLTVSPVEAGPGEEVAVTCIVTNTAGIAGTIDAVFSVNREIIEVRPVNLEGGESAEVSFTTTSTESGVTIVTINGKSASFTVIDESAPPVTPTTSTVGPHITLTTMSATSTPSPVSSAGFNWTVFAVVCGGLLAIGCVAGIFVWKKRRS